MDLNDFQNDGDRTNLPNTPAHQNGNGQDLYQNFYSPNGNGAFANGNEAFAQEDLSELMQRRVTELPDHVVGEIQVMSEIQFRMNLMREKLQMRRDVLKEDIDTILNLQSELNHLRRARNQSY